MTGNDSRSRQSFIHSTSIPGRLFPAPAGVLSFISREQLYPIYQIHEISGNIILFPLTYGISHAIVRVYFK